MNFYKHHIGDYAQATGHLSFVEDAAYSRLIRKYYAEEKPLPADIKSVQRIIAARSHEERKAVETVLNEFFVLDEDGWHNKRCDSELDAWRKQAETNRRTAEEREARKRKNKSSNDSCTNRADYDNDSLDESFNESSTVNGRSREPNQNPESRIQNPELKSSSPPHDDDDASNGARIPIEQWPDPLGMMADLHGLCGIPPDFIDAQLIEFRAFWSGKTGLIRGEWDSKFAQRCRDQWDRRQQIRGIP